MKPRKVKTKINQMVRILGSRQEVANKLEIALSYIYQLEKGRTPGLRLYRDICKLYKETTTIADKDRIV